MIFKILLYNTGSMIVKTTAYHVCKTAKQVLVKDFIKFEPIIFVFRSVKHFQVKDKNAVISVGLC